MRKLYLSAANIVIGAAGIRFSSITHSHSLLIISVITLVIGLGLFLEILTGRGNE